MDHKGNGRAVAVLFLSFITVISVLSVVLPQKTFSASENRYLQKRPEFTIASLLDGSFGRAYELYLSDQFPGRNGWIGVKVGTERLAGQKDVNGVYFGRDHYLIEQFEEETLIGPLLDQNLDSLAGFVQYAVNKYGTDHTRVMLVPSASQVLTEKLPQLAVPYDQSIITDKLRQRLNGLLGDTAAGQIIVPVEQALKERSQEGLYYRTDHHWTAKGAYTGYRAWAVSMGLEPWKEEAFMVKTVSNRFHGTVYSKVNVAWPYDTIELYLPGEEQIYEVTYDRDGTVHDTLYSMKALEGKDQYSVYLDGNHGLTEIVRKQVPKEQKGKKLLIVKDSFAHSFAPFAANSFETVTMVDLRYMNVGLQTFLEDGPYTDVLVLYQIPGFAKDKHVGKMNRQ